MCTIAAMEDDKLIQTNIKSAFLYSRMKPGEGVPCATQGNNTPKPQTQTSTQTLRMSLALNKPEDDGIRSYVIL